MALQGPLGDRDFRVGGSAPACRAVITAVRDMTLVMCLAVIYQGSGTGRMTSVMALKQSPVIRALCPDPRSDGRAL